MEIVIKKRVVNKLTLNVVKKICKFLKVQYRLEGQEILNCTENC